MGIVRNRKVRSFNSYSGKKFRSSDWTRFVLYAILDPMEYGFSRAPQHLKTQGKGEWERLAEIYVDEKEKAKKTRWI
jgi:hypothetical protein